VPSGYHRFLESNTIHLGRKQAISLHSIGTVFRSSPSAPCDTNVWTWTKTGKSLYFVLGSPECLPIDIGYSVPGCHTESDVVVRSPHQCEAVSHVQDW